MAGLKYNELEGCGKRNDISYVIFLSGAVYPTLSST